MRKEFKYITAISIILTLALIILSGLKLPWNEEAAIYAIYGATVGFYIAIVFSMLLVWKIKKALNK